MPRVRSLSRLSANRSMKLQLHRKFNHNRKRRPTRLQPNQLKRNAQAEARTRGADGDAAAAGGEGVDPGRMGLHQRERHRGSMLPEVMSKRRLSWLLPLSQHRAFPKAA